MKYSEAFTWKNSERLERLNSFPEYATKIRKCHMIHLLESTREIKTVFRVHVLNVPGHGSNLDYSTCRPAP